MPPQRRAAKPAHSRLHRPSDWTTAAAISAGLALYWAAEALTAALADGAFERARFAYTSGLLVSATLLTWQSAHLTWRLWQNRRGAERQALIAAALSLAVLIAASALDRRYLPLAVTPWPLYAALLTRRAALAAPANPTPAGAAKGRPVSGSGTTSATAG
jgi:hypothetical protein